MTDEGVRGNLVLGRSAEGRPGEILRRRDIEPLGNRSMNTMSRDMMKRTMTMTKTSTMVKNKVGTMGTKATTMRKELPRKRLQRNTQHREIDNLTNVKGVQGKGGRESDTTPFAGNMEERK